AGVEPAPARIRSKVPVSDLGDNTYTFNMPGEPVTINATFGTATGVNNVRMTNDGKVRYIDMFGRVSDKPFSGLNIVIDANGNVSKVMK
ncbi:MAG: hypothetical protein IK092_07580, partial [Muribaculaceae bacterium]|nr:hypothetical protein [Muribaculaceae bacterium]